MIENILYEKPTATRQAYGNAIARLGEKYEELIVIDADLSASCQTGKFAEKFSDRAFNVGIQETQMVNLAAGLAAYGKTMKWTGEKGKWPLVHSFAKFSTGIPFNAIDQNIGYTGLPVGIIGSHGGCATGEDGYSHHGLWDVGLMRLVTGIAVVEPSDAYLTEYLTEDLIERIFLKKDLDGFHAFYLRLHRPKVPLIHGENREFDVLNYSEYKVGKGYRLNDYEDKTLIASGKLVSEALKVFEMTRDVCVVDMPSIIPIDERLIKDICRNTERIYVAQDHRTRGGLGAEVSRAILKHGLHRNIKSFEVIGVDCYTESGKTDELYDKYGLSAERLIEKLKL